MNSLLSRRTRRILGFVRPHAKHLLLVLALMVVGTLIDLSFPWILGETIDTALREAPDGAGQRLVPLIGVEASRKELLKWFAGALVVLSLLRIVIGALRGYLQTWVAAHITFDMRVDLFTHLQVLPMRFFASTKIGDIMSRLGGDITEIQSVATGALVGFVTTILSLIGTVAFLVYYSWKLFLITCLITPLAALLLSRFRQSIQAVAREVRERNADLASLTIESLSGMRFVRSVGAEDTEAGKYQRSGRELIRTLLRFQVVSALGGSLPGSLLAIGAAVALLVGGFMVIDGTLTLGGLTAFAIYQGRLFGPLQGLLGLYMSIQRARASVDRVFEYLDLAPETPDAPHAIDPGRIRGRVEFDEVSFEYEVGKKVLEGASFTVEPGQRVALVGASGTGKSTLIDLLWRFYHPSHGRVLIDQHDLRDLQLAPLVEQMMVVSQEPYLFNTTLRENVRYGRPAATDREIEAAVQAADLAAMVAGLDDGLDTEVGERGVQLSTGQRQRVALARAFLRRPRVLVLDEATSSLDWISEDAVRRSIDQLMEGTTTLIITHRVARARDADQILVLEDGRITARGGHAELVEGGGLYAQLVRREIGSGDDRNRRPPATPALSRGPWLPGTGAGVRVALVDSGANVPHPHIRRIAAGATVTVEAGAATTTPGFADNNGHGTATAALLNYLAPDAELVAIKIFERELRTTQEHLRGAIGWALDQGCRVINLSLGTPGGPHTEPLHEICRRVVERGGIIVAASPSDVEGFPAAFEEVIAVGEDRALGDDEIRRGEHTDFVACGYARPRPGVHPEANFKGSSFAAARVASLVARLLEQEPEADLQRVRARLLEWCEQPSAGADLPS